MKKSVRNSEYIGDELFWGKTHFSKKGLLAFIFESERNNVTDNHNIYMEWCLPLNPGLPHYRQILYQLSHREARLPFSSCYNLFSLSLWLLCPPLPFPTQDSRLKIENSLEKWDILKQLNHLISLRWRNEERCEGMEWLPCLGQIQYRTYPNTKNLAVISGTQRCCKEKP